MDKLCPHQASSTAWLSDQLVGNGAIFPVIPLSRQNQFETRRQAMDEVIDWMTFYNHRRIHSTLGYVSPMQFERSWHAAQLSKAA